MADLLDENAVIAAAARLPGWTRKGREIERTFEFRDFDDALAFVNRVGALAREAGHHPDISLRWNKVTLSLTTHSRGGLTSLDFALAEAIDRLPPQRPPHS